MAQWGAYGYAQQGARTTTSSRTTTRARRSGGVRHEGARVPRAGTVAADGLVPTPFTCATGSASSGTSLRAADLRARSEDQDDRRPAAQQLPHRSRSTPARRRSGSATARTAARCRSPLRTGRCARSTRVGLEAYLYGVVPSEMPATGCPRRSRRRRSPRARTRSRVQEERLVVRPLPGHAEPGLSRHRPRGAVDDRGRATRPRARSSSTAGKVATTYFFSSSGGRTASASEVWPSAPARRTSSRSTTRTTRSRRTTAGARSSFRRRRCRRVLGVRGS